MKRPSWDEYFFHICDVVAERSHDKNTKLGCVIVDSNNHIISTGFNGLPPGVDDEFWPTDRSEEIAVIKYKTDGSIDFIVKGDEFRPDDSFDCLGQVDKYSVMIHAELNALLHAKCDLTGCRLYIPFIPCTNCALAIISSGIKKVVVQDKFMINPKWRLSQLVALELFKQAGVEVSEISKNKQEVVG